MKRNSLGLIIALMTAGLSAAESTPKQSLLEGVARLANKDNYSWKTSVEAPGEPTGTIVGKTEKDGASVLTLARSETSFQGVIKGNKAVIKTDDGWKSAAEVVTSEDQSGGARLVSAILQHFKLPPAETSDMVGKTKEIALADGVYSGTLSEESAKDILVFHIPNRVDGPKASHAEGTARYWLKDGVLVKCQYNIKGTVSLRGDERDLERVFTTEISDIGSTKAVPPDEAAKKL